MSTLNDDWLSANTREWWDVASGGAAKRNERWNQAAYGGSDSQEDFIADRTSEWEDAALGGGGDDDGGDDGGGDTSMGGTSDTANLGGAGVISTGGSEYGSGDAGGESSGARHVGQSYGYGGTGGVTESGGAGSGGMFNASFAGGGMVRRLRRRKPMPTMRRNPAGGVIDTTGMGRGAGVVRPPMGMQAFRRGGRVRGYQEGGEVEDEEDQQPYQVAQATPDTMRGGGNTDVIQDAVTRTLNPPVQEMYERLNPPKGSGSAYRDVLDYQAARNPRVQGAMREGQQMPPDPRQQAWRPQAMPVASAGVVPTGDGGSWGGWLSDKLHGAVSPGLNTRAGSRRRMMEPEYADGGFVGDDDLEDQGYDDATIDPMAMINSAMNYGRKKYGLPADDQGEMSFDDGGVVPTQPDQQEGNPNAIDPRQAMAYLAGDGAVSPEIAQALEQRVDPQGQLNPTQRATAAIGVAPNDEAKFGLIQHYRTKYNGFAAAAKAALTQGNMGEAAKQATMAMDSVPNGERTQFAPASGGLAMISRPAFRQGGGKSAPPQQQAFDDGGVVKNDDDEEVLSHMQPQPQADPPDVPADVPDVAVPAQVPITSPQPQIMPVQSVVQMLDDGFDTHLSPKPAIAAPMFQTPAVTSYALDDADAQRSAQLGGWGSAAEYAATQQRPNTFDPVSKAIQGSLLPTPATPAPTTGSEAATRPPEDVEAPAAAAPATAPVTAPVTQQGVIPEGAVVDENRVNPFTGQIRAAVPGTFGSREAARRAGTTVPMNEAAARGGGTEGVVPTATAAPERAMPRGNFGDSTGTLNIPAQEAPLTGKWANRGGRPPNEEEQDIERNQRRAAAAYPAVGADAAKRQAEIAAGLKRDDEHRKAIGVAEVKATTAEQIAANRLSGAADLEDRKAVNRSALQTQKDVAALTRKQSGQEAAMNLALAKGKLAAASAADIEGMKVLSGMMRNDPSLQANPGKLLNLAGPLMASMKLKPEELMHAVNALAAGGGAAPAAAPPSSGTGTSYLENMVPGDGAPRNYGGKAYNFYLSPDGREMVREDLYEKRFGKKPNG